MYPVPGNKTIFIVAEAGGCLCLEVKEFYFSLQQLIS
jgi:hypothetical protein